MAYDIGARIGLEGEKDYKRAITEISNSQKVLRSEMGLLAAQFEDQEDSVESLTKKQELLERTLYTQQDKVDTLRAALQNAAVSFGEADARTMRWQEQLNHAEAELIATNRAIRNTADALEDLTSISNRYKGKLDEIEESLTYAESVLRRVKAENEAFGKTTESISAKQDALNNILTLQTQKVETLKEALAEATVKYGEADNRTKDFQTQLNRAEAELARTNNQLKKTSEALNDVEENLGETDTDFETLTENLDVTKSGTVGLGDALDQIGSKFGISLPNEMTSTLNGMAQINTKTLALTGGLAALAAAIVGVEKKLIDLTRESAAYVDDLNTLSDTSGISVEKLQEYSYAAELLNVSVDKLSQSHIEVTKSMNDAMNGSAERIEAFNRLGVTYSYTNGVLRDSEEVFWEVIDALGEVENTTERDALAMKILSESATELNPLIEAGSEKMREFAEEAQNAGYVLDEEAISSLQDADDAMQRFEKTTEAAKNQLAAEFAPYLEESTDKMTKFVGNLGKALKDSGVVDAFGILLETVVDLILPVDSLNEEGLPKLTETLKPLARIIATIADTLTVIVGIIKYIWEVATGDWLFNWGRGMDEALDMVTTGLGWNVSQGKPSASYRIDHLDAFDTSTYDESVGAWVGNVSSEQLKEETTGKDAYSVLREMYEASGFNGSFGDWRSLNGYAMGTNYFHGGAAWVGENGPEKVYLPQGSQILTAQESRNEGNTVIYVTIDAKNVREFNDIVKIAQEARMKSRKEKG